jgi:choline dehydrogenase-like flavoprotein
LIADVDTLVGNEDLSADLAVVGAGPAGIVTALEVARQGFDVLLVESGRKTFKPEIQQLAEAADWDQQLHAPMSMAVRRQLGGTSVVWGGKCVPLDPVDFDYRSFIGASTWPVSYGELLSYFQRACDWLVCGRAVFETTSMRQLPSTLVPGLSDGEVRASTLERWSLPTNFGRAYRQRLNRSPRIRVITGLTCTEVICRSGERSVDHLECRSLDGKRVRVRARAYVIAAGGLDSTRLLLASKDSYGVPLGDHSGHLGSWYMSHVEGAIANVRFFTDPRRTVFGYERDIDGTYVRRRFTVTQEVQHKLELPNVAAWLANPELADPRHRNAILSFVYLTLRSPVGRLVSPDAQRLSMTGEDVPGAPYGGAEKGPTREHLKNIVLGSASAAHFAASFGTKRFLARGRRVPGFFVYSPQNLYPLQYHGEQAPNPRSRVSLTNQRDALGMPKLRIDIQFLQQDVDGIIRTHQLWDDYLRRRGCGRLEYTSEDPAATVWSRVGGAFHQLGTTRMAELPENGVVDKNLAVHGVTNLFVASSSVFVTSGQANPTFTIVVLALRLADRLRSVLREL